MKNRIRLDAYLCSNSLCNTPEKAKNYIITGWVRINGETVRDPSRIISESDDIRVSRPGGDFVSRGGIKLAHALKKFDISVKGIIAADLGASTGGFTDCLLQNGAARVYAVDNGYGSLAYELRTDPRVVVKERTNVRHLKKKDFPESIGFVTVDLSFISILKIIDIIKNTIAPVSGVILVKPQFEALESEHTKGVVRQKEDHIKILERLLFFIKDAGIIIKGLEYSPIKGPAGNIEFLLYLIFNFAEQEKELSDIDITDIVNSAHAYLN